MCEKFSQDVGLFVCASVLNEIRTRFRSLVRTCVRVLCRILGANVYEHSDTCLICCISTSCVNC